MKKAQSEVITTVLIILLVLAAVFIVYTAVRSMVTDTTGTASDRSKCVGIDLRVASAVANIIGPEADPIIVTRYAGGTDDAVTPIIVVNGTRKDTMVFGALKQYESGTVDTVDIGLKSDDNVSVGAKIGSVYCDVTNTIKATA